jgi:single-stranded-DNA-specific exonuclease
MQTQAFDVLRQLHIDERGELPFGLCLYDASWHVGVIGILASRIKDRYHRPVIIFADNGEGELKGSARSVAGVHIRDMLDNIAALHPGLLLKFGGHAMAAGLSISSDNLALFQSAFDTEIRRHLGEDSLQGVVFTDGELLATELTLDTAKSLREAEPWGQHFPEPLFDGIFKIRQQRIVGAKHLKLSLQHPQLSRLIDAIAFNCIDATAKESPYSIDQSLRIAYRLDINEYQSNTNLQLLVEYMEVVSFYETTVSTERLGGASLFRPTMP